jgi:ethanolamine ammonia-lyase large subunit
LFKSSVGFQTFQFDSLKVLLAKATPLRSGDSLAGIAAIGDAERVAAQIALADLPLKHFLNEAVIPYEDDEVTRLIMDSHDQSSFQLISHLTVGDFRNWLLVDETNGDMIASVSKGLTPEMVSAVSKIMRNQDLILVAKKCFNFVKKGLFLDLFWNLFWNFFWNFFWNLYTFSHRRCAK